VRAALVPEGFGELGHYRPGAIEDNRAKGVKFAGHLACLECHEDVGSEKAQGAHAGVRCEACHGALAEHAADPASVTPARPETTALCVVCHAANVAKPKGFPQVVPAEHSGGASCSDCHRPHRPEPV
jgi:hypothetical protein